MKKYFFFQNDPFFRKISNSYFEISFNKKWCKKNSVIVEKVGPFKPSKENKIGEITKYYHNYEFSMDLRFSESDLQRGWTQLLVGIV